MSKIILDDDSTNLDPLVINENFRKIEEEFNEKVLYRKNPEGEPNEMENHLDMNEHRIYNLPEPQEGHEPLRLSDIGFLPEEIKEYAEESKEWAEKSKDYYEHTLEALAEGEVYIGDYGPGLTINSYTEFFGKDGIWYRPSPDLELPYTTTGDWETEGSLFVAVGDQALRQDLLNSDDPNLGASLIGFKGRNISFYEGLIVSPFWYGAAGDGIHDDTQSVQRALDELEASGGGVLELYGKFLVGSLVVNTPYVLIRGRSQNDKIIVKDGELGVHVKHHWVNFESITIQSQGNKDDGLNTSGILYDKGGLSSTGFVLNNNFTVIGFSGYGVRVVNAISYSWDTCYVVGCNIGVQFSRDEGNVLFSTTVFFNNVYLTDCNVGIKGDYVYRSSFNVIGEYCDYAMDMFAGDFTLYRCYFEKNNIFGARVRNAIIQDLYTYSNDPTKDSVDIEFQQGVINPNDRGYIRQKTYGITAKSVSLLSKYGVDPVELSGQGTTENVGLEYGLSTVALIRGENILNPRAWKSTRLAEFKGWHNVRQGYEISGTSAGDLTHGISQEVSLVAGRKYIVDFTYTPINGTISTIRVGSQVVTSGVPFILQSGGSVDVRAFGVSQSSGLPIELYIHVFTLSEVVSSPKQTAEANERLTRQKEGRGSYYDTSSPVSGTWRRGEIIYNANPSPGGFVGWVCVETGSPGSWKGFGSISA